MYYELLKLSTSILSYPLLFLTANSKREHLVTSRHFLTVQIQYRPVETKKFNTKMTDKCFTCTAPSKLPISRQFSAAVILSLDSLSDTTPAINISVTRQKPTINITRQLGSRADSFSFVSSNFRHVCAVYILCKIV